MGTEEGCGKEKCGKMEEVRLEVSVERRKWVGR